MDKIICLGKNYHSHVEEMGDAPIDAPLIFLKPPSVRRQAGRSGERLKVPFPQVDSSVSPECEVAVWVSKGGYRLTEAEAQSRIGWVTLALDITLREIQTKLKKAGHPWTIAKVFPDSAILGPWKSIDEFPDFMNSEFQLSQGGIIKQHALPTMMTTKPAAAIAYASQFFQISPGDIIFTGTPAGVITVQSGDVVSLSWGKINYEVEWI